MERTRKFHPNSNGNAPDAGYISDMEYAPPSLGSLEKRLASNSLGEARNIAAAAVDLYAARLYWDSAYAPATGLRFRQWFVKTVPFSLAYGLDLIKLVRELADPRGKSGPDVPIAAMQELVQSMVEVYGIGILREVLHAPPAIKDEYLGRIVLRGPLDIQAFRSRLAMHRQSECPKPDPLVVDRAFVVRGKSYASLASLSRELPELGEWLERTVNAAYRAYGKSR
jgi:hypothetical protein